MIFLFSSSHLNTSRNFLICFNTCHPNISFSSEQEKNRKLSFLDVEVSREKGKFVTFSGVYSHFESFLQTLCRFWYGLYSCLLLLQIVF